MSDEAIHNPQWSHFPYTIPNVVTLLRLPLAPAMLIPAYRGNATVFLILFALCMLTDFLDGLLARLLDQRSVIGTRLDSLGDIMMYMFGLRGGWLLWPDRLQPESVLIFAAISAASLSGIISFIKNRRLPAYHTLLTRVASAGLGIASFLMFADILSFPFRMALILLIIASTEETVITFVLPHYAPNIRSIPHAIKTRKESHADK